MTLLDPSGLRDTTGDEYGGGCGTECIFKLMVERGHIGGATPPDPRIAVDPCFRAVDACTYWVTGGPTGTVEVRNNDDGPFGWFVAIIGLLSPEHSTANTMTLGPNLIVSTVNVSPHGELLAHEVGHTPDAQEMGSMYFLNYLRLLPGTTHATHPMEQAANNRANLPPDWSGGYRTEDWVNPFNLTVWRSRP